MSPCLEPALDKIGYDSSVRKLSYDFDVAKIADVYVYIMNLPDHPTLFGLGTIDPENEIHVRPLLKTNQTLREAGLKRGDLVFVTTATLHTEGLLSVSLMHQTIDACVMHKGTDFVTPGEGGLVVWSVKGIASMAKSRGTNPTWREKIVNVLFTHMMNHIGNKNKDKHISKGAKALLRLYKEARIKPENMTAREAVLALCTLIVPDFNSIRQTELFVGNKHILPIFEGDFIESLAKRVLLVVESRDDNVSALADFLGKLKPNHDASLIVYNTSPYRTPLYKILMNEYFQSLLSPAGWMGAAAILGKVIHPITVQRGQNTTLLTNAEYGHILEDVKRFIPHILPSVLDVWPATEVESELGPMSSQNECGGMTQHTFVSEAIDAINSHVWQIMLLVGWSTESRISIPYSVIRALLHPDADKISNTKGYNVSITKIVSMICMCGMRVKSQWIFGHGSDEHAASVLAAALPNITTVLHYKKSIEMGLTESLKGVFVEGLESSVGPYPKCKAFLSKNKEIAALFMTPVEIARVCRQIVPDSESDSDSDSDATDSDTLSRIIRERLQEFIQEHEAAAPESDGEDPAS